VYDPAMLWKRARPVPELCADVTAAMERLDGRAASRAGRAAARAVLRGVSQADLDEGLARLLPAVQRIAFGNGPGLVQLVAGLVEAGADPRPALETLVERVGDGLEFAARFPAVAMRMGGRPSAPNNSREAAAILERVRPAAARLGIDEREAGLIMQCWFAVNDWIPGLLLPLQQKRARRALPDRPRLIGVTRAMLEHAADAIWLLGLLLVLDDERLTVVHRPTGAVFEITMSGVGDNTQLDTLLASVLLGGQLPGEPPGLAWVEAATTAPLARIEIWGHFAATDAHGNSVRDEGRPADIPVVGGRRIIVLDAPDHIRAWTFGRSYPLMYPEIHLDRRLPADEAAAVHELIHPAG
jgi:hypothetical protein